MPATERRARLRWPHGQGKVVALDLHPDGPTIFGRGKECDHRLPGRFLSRRHFLIVPDGHGYLLIDLASRNGTFLGDRRIRIARLRPGSVVRGGDRILLFEDVSPDGVACRGCGRKVPSGGFGGSELCLVCRHRYPLLGETVAGVTVTAPLDERPGLVDYAGTLEGRPGEVRLRILERDVPRRLRKLLVELKHPHLVRVLSAGRHGGRSAIVTEMPPPVTLANLVQTDLPLSGNVALRLMKGIARALVAIHERRAAHGGLMLDEIGIDEGGEAVLDDLGLGEILPREETETDWFSPPERRGARRRLDVTDDVYAFGAVLYQALTGRPPVPDFAAGSLEAARPLPRRRPDLAARLVYVVGRALAADPVERYATSAELLADLEAGKVLSKKTGTPRSS